MWIFRRYQQWVNGRSRIKRDKSNILAEFNEREELADSAFLQLIDCKDGEYGVCTVQTVRQYLSQRSGIREKCIYPSDDFDGEICRVLRIPEFNDVSIVVLLETALGFEMPDSGWEKIIDVESRGGTIGEFVNELLDLVERTVNSRS
jgi:hypothetical protein